MNEEAQIISLLDNNWDELVKNGDKMQFHKGQVLFYEGHQPYGIFVILSGEVSTSSVADPCNDKQSQSSLHGEVLGLDPYIHGTPFCCTGIAEKDSQVLFISRSLLEPIMD